MWQKAKVQKSEIGIHCTLVMFFTVNERNVWKSISNTPSVSKYNITQDQFFSLNNQDDKVKLLKILLHLFCCQNRSQLQYGNIMYDRRVVRGNLQGQQVISKVWMKHLCYPLFLHFCHHYYFLIESPFGINKVFLNFEWSCIPQFLQNNHSDPGMQQRQQAYRRRAIARKQAKDQLKTKTPEAIQGRQHVDVQTGEAL